MEQRHTIEWPVADNNDPVSRNVVNAIRNHNDNRAYRKCANLSENHGLVERIPTNFVIVVVVVVVVVALNTVKSEIVLRCSSLFFILQCRYRLTRRACDAYIYMEIFSYWWAHRSGDAVRSNNRIGCTSFGISCARAEPYRRTTTLRSYGRRKIHLKRKNNWIISGKLRVRIWRAMSVWLEFMFFSWVLGRTGTW